MAELIKPGVQQLLVVDDNGRLRNFDLPMVTDDPVDIALLKRHGAVEKVVPIARYYPTPKKTKEVKDDSYSQRIRLSDSSTG